MQRSFSRITVGLLVGLTLSCGSGADKADRVTTIAGTVGAAGATVSQSKRSSVDAAPAAPAVPANFEAAQALRARDRFMRAAWYARAAENAETATVAITPPNSGPIPSATVSAPSTSSHGPHSDAWWHGVATCEQGGRNDPYFGYFSYMDGSAGGKTWAEQVAMGNATIARYGEDMNNGGAWAHACVLAGYRASPGG